MKLPTQPNTCAWPWAWSQAGEIKPTLSRPLISSRFQTPRNVPGNSMKNNPVLTKAISKRERPSSRARVRANTSVGESPGPLNNAVVSANEADTIISPRPLRFPIALREEKECCFPGAHGGEGPSRSPQDPGRQPGNLYTRLREPCSRRSAFGFAASTPRQSRDLSSSNGSDSARFGRAEAQRYCLPLLRVRASQ